MAWDGKPAEGQFLAVASAQGRVAFLPYCEISLKTANPKPYPTDPKTVGGHLKKRRYELGLRQKDVAALLKVNEFTVCGWENDKKAPAVRYLPRIIEFLGYYPFLAPRTLAERLLACRRHLGLSRKRMAQRFSVDEGTLTHWEKDRRVPRGEQLKLVESSLDRMLILSFDGRSYTA